MKRKYKQPPFEFGTDYRDPKIIQAHSMAFNRDQYTKLPDLFTQQTFELLKREVEKLEFAGQECNFVMQGCETPRIMTTLGGAEVRRHSNLLRALYANPRLRTILSAIAGTRLYNSHDPNEWMVATWLRGEGQTHGHHLDDPPVALIVIIESPDPALGGSLEVIPQWRETCGIFDWDPETEVLPRVSALRDMGLVQTKTHATGQAYLLRADRCLHAVAPLRGGDTRRTILNLAFEIVPNIHRVSESASALFALRP